MNAVCRERAGQVGRDVGNMSATVWSGITKVLMQRERVECGGVLQGGVGGVLLQMAYSGECVDGGVLGFFLL